MPFIPPMFATRLEDPRRLADPRYIASPSSMASAPNSMCRAITPSTKPGQLHIGVAPPMKTGCQRRDAGASVSRSRTTGQVGPVAETPSAPLALKERTPTAERLLS